MNQSINIIQNAALSVSFGNYSANNVAGANAVRLVGYFPRAAAPFWPGTEAMNIAADVTGNNVSANLNAALTAGLPAGMVGSWYLRTTFGANVADIDNGLINVANAAGSGVPSTSVQQTGNTPLVSGQQGPYPVLFNPAFPSVPNYFSPTLNLANNVAETFELSYSDLTASGANVWLSGVPTNSSNNSLIKWIATLQ